jgi:uncharacterized protein (DUF2164 family)
MGEVLSRAEGYNTLVGLIGPLTFHFICMFLGGFFFQKGLRKAAAEPSSGTVV